MDRIRARADGEDHQALGALPRRFGDRHPGAELVGRGAAQRADRIAIVGALAAPIKVFGEVREASAWLAPHVQEVCGEDASANELSAAITELSTLLSQRVVRAPMTDA